MLKAQNCHIRGVIMYYMLYIFPNTYSFFLFQTYNKLFLKGQNNAYTYGKYINYTQHISF